MSSAPPTIADLRIGVVGAGLIGGSVIRRALAAGCATLVHDEDPAATAAAAALGATAGRLDEVIAGSDLVVLAIAPAEAGRLWGRVATAAGAPPGSTGRADAPRTLFLDVASVKSPVVAAVEASDATWSTTSELLVLTHPMAGREASGWPASDPGLFEAAAWTVSPTATMTGRELARILAFIDGMGAHACFIDAAFHDRFAAVVSHLPHVLSFALRSLVEQEDPAEAWRTFAGGSLQDMLRISDSNEHLWSEVFSANREELKRLATKLHALAEHSIAADPAGLADMRSADRAPRSRTTPPPAATGPVQTFPLDAAIGAAATGLAGTAERGLEVGSWTVRSGTDLQLTLVRREDRG